MVSYVFDMFFYVFHFVPFVSYVFPIVLRNFLLNKYQSSKHFSFSQISELIFGSLHFWFVSYIFLIFLKCWKLQTLRENYVK